MVKKSHVHKTDVSRWFFLFASAMTLFLFWHIIEGFVITIVTAAIAAIMLNPVERFVRKKLKNRHISSVLVSLAFLLVILTPLSIAGILMVGQAQELIDGAIGEAGWMQSFDVTQSSLYQTLPGIVQDKIASIDIAALGNDTFDWVVKNIGAIFAGTANVILQILIFFAQEIL